MLRDESEQKVLLDVMPRFDITQNQIEAILSDDREKVSISSNIDEIQVVSSYCGEFYGTDEINRYMQKVFNGIWYKRVGIDGISLFDKVIQYRNRPQSDMAYAYNLSTRKTERHNI